MDEGLLGRDALKDRGKRKYETVELDRGGKVRIQSLSELELSRFEVAMLDGKGNWSADRMAEARRLLLAMCIVDCDGERLFADDETEEIKQLDGGDAKRIYTASLPLSGWTERDVEDLVKNSTSGPDAASQ